MARASVSDWKEIDTRRCKVTEKNIAQGILKNV